MTTPLLQRSLALLPLLFVLSCKTHAPSSSTPQVEDKPVAATTPKPSQSPRLELGSLRVIHHIDWPAAPWGVSLVGVDSSSKKAILLLKDRQQDNPRLTIQQIDLGSGKLSESWDATEENARDMVLGYPSFRGMDGAFSSDLLRYASLIHAVGGWSYKEASPPLGVLPSPDLSMVIYGQQPGDGRDGDWLMMLNAMSKKSSRLDYGLRASYHPSFSPDGKWIAWIGGSSEYALPGRQIGYVLRVAGTDDLKHHALSRVRDGLRTPVWSHDSRTLYAFGKQARGSETCLFGVEMPRMQIEEIFCHPASFDIMLSPSGKQALLLLQSPKNSGQMLVTLDFATGDEIMQMEVNKVQGLGSFGIWLGEDRFGLLSKLGAELIVLNTTTGDEIARYTLSDEDTMLIGRYGMKVVDGELIALRQHLKDDRLELVAIRLVEQ